MFRSVLIALCSIALTAQVAAPPSFDVASVKPNKSGSGSSSQNYGHGSLIATNVTLHDCIKLAYGVKDYQISGPVWLNSEHYDIAAKTESPVTADLFRTMIQTLLAERLNVKVHRETKQLPVYALVAGKNGLNLHAVDAGPEKDGLGRGYISGQRMSMANLADKLSQLLDRPVIDRTGTKGVFDVELKWVADGERRREGDNPDGPTSVFTALQEQLGLKLEAGKGPVEMIVVDHAEKEPTGN